MKESSDIPLKTERSVLILILSVTFLIKLILLFLLDPFLRSDSLDYQTLANSILNGEYSLNGKPTAYVGIGYPAFLSGIFFIFGEGQFYVRLIQSVIEAGTALLFYGVSRRFFSIKYSLLSVTIYSFFPSNILYSQTILSEPLFGFFSMAVLYLFLRDDFSKKPFKIFFAGLIFGLAVLIRTAYLPVCILVPLYFNSHRNEIFKSSKIKSAVIFSLIFFMGMIIVIAPWSIRNKLMVGTYSLGTTSGLNFWAGSNPDATGSYFMKPEDKLPGDYSNEADRDREYFKLGLEYAVSHPVNYMILGIKKIGYLFSSERMIINYFSETLSGQTSTDVYRSANPLFTLLVNIPYFIIIMLGLWGLMFFERKKFFIYGSVLIWMITVAAFIALARYHYVLIPFFILGTVMFISTGKGSLNKISTGKKIFAAGFSLFLITVWTVEFYLILS